MLDEFKKEISERLKGYFEKAYGVSPEVRFTKPPSLDVADIATPIGFILAKRLRRRPEEIAEEAKKAISDLPFVERVEVVKGYLNVFLNKREALRRLLENIDRLFEFPPKEEKVVIEHTNINPNKAAHIGHVRNAVLGDSLARLLRAYGYRVEVQNYIDDTGVQVADTVVGLRFLKGLRDPKQLDELEPLDKYTRRLYAEVNRLYEEDPELLKRQREVLKAIEEGSSELAKFAKHVAERICRRHIETMLRLGIKYDLLTRESDIVHLGLAKFALEKLKEAGVAEEGEEEFAGAIVIKLPKERFKGLEKAAKVLVRSDGTFTYLLKDIGYTLRKFGLVDRDFLYRVFLYYPDGKPLWSTSKEGEQKEFGRGDRVINVIDVRQAPLQQIIKYALESLGYKEQAKRFVHYAYGVVYLSKRTAERFGIKSEKEIVKMSGRKGIGIIADDLMDEIERIAYENVKQKHPELEDSKAREIARKIMIGAVRYMMLKYDRMKPMVFDLEEAMSLSGESGPYVQYSVVRARRILEKAGGFEKDVSGAFECDKERPLVRTLLEARETFIEAAEKMDPQMLAKYAYNLALRFNEFYESCPVLSAEEPQRSSRLAIVRAYVEIMSKILEVLGIPLVEVMRCGCI